MENSKQVIFNKHCAGWLMMQGCCLIETSKSNKPDMLNRKIYIFDKTNHLIQQLKEYKNIYKK